ncbi:transglutaminase domain-containing protein [Candidatus Woesearchaeota archaeon]|nr:transglutaminase domain-containing protein [Candidatus Woesearchaeota archaeon]
MKMVSLFFCMLLSLLAPVAVSAVGSDLFDMHSLSLDLVVSNDFDILPRGTSYHVQKLTAKMFWYPQDDYRQEVDFINTDPLSDFAEGEGFTFSWANPSANSYVIRQSSRLTTKNEFFPVKRKVSFPLKDLDPAYSIYLQPREIIDLNDRIRSIASRLAEGETDAYVVVFKLANWVEDNVEYDLNSLTADASQKASWVLENKRGVCDELTSLFISMCRSLGIPARFVSGISYSNVNRQNDGWGPHGWAEVYFPDIGWAPFDVTYKELGYVDATHIKLKTSVDAKESSVEYSIIGQNVDVRAGGLRFDVDVPARNYMDNPPVELSATVAEDLVGFGSYNLVTLKVKNSRSYYVTDRLYLSNISELKILGDNRLPFVLAPYEQKSFYWIVKVNDDLNPSYLYTFPISINGELGESTQVSFRVNQRSSIYSEAFMRSRIPSSLESSKPYSESLDVSCFSGKSEVLLNENIVVTCSLSNKGSKSLSNLKACFEKNCTYIALPAGESRDLSYSTEFKTLGVKTLVFRADHPLASKTSYIVIPVQDEPLVNVFNLTYPEELGFSESAEIRFILKRDSINPPKNLVVKLDHELIKEDWKFTALENTYEIRFLFRGENLALDDNDFKLSLLYEDAKGREYSSDKEFTVRLKDPSFFQLMALWINSVDVKLTRWIDENFEN